MLSVFLFHPKFVPHFHCHVKMAGQTHAICRNERGKYILFSLTNVSGKVDQSCKLELHSNFPQKHLQLQNEAEFSEDISVAKLFWNILSPHAEW